MYDGNLLNTLINFIGTALGAVTGILVSNRLSAYRIEQLEKKFDSLDKKFDNVGGNINTLTERVIIVEQSSKSAHHRIDDMVTQLNIKERRN